MGDITRRISLLILISSLFVICVQIPTSDAFPQSLREIGRRLRRYIINDHEVTVNVEWLTDEQLSELGTLDSLTQVAKIREFYENLVSSEERKAAANKIVSQCYDWLPEVTTEAERTELKRLHHANHTECRARIGEYISRLAENRQKHLRKFWSFCEHVSNDTTRYSEHVEDGEIPEDEEENVEGFTAESTVTTTDFTSTTTFESATPSSANHQQHRRHLINPKRFRRSEHHHHSPIHDLEECFKAHLSWLDDSQKNQLRGLKSEGKTEAEIQAKIFEFYGATTGETKVKATELLKGGCVDVFKSVFGAEKYEEVKKMKEAGSTIEDISNKMTEYLTHIQDENKKSIAQGFSPFCKKLFTSNQSRKRRNIHDHEQHHDLSDYYKTHLSWLSDEQKEELKALKAEGKGVKEMKAKIQEYYSKTTGETKEKATELLKAGCTELFKNIFGEEKFQDVKKLKESGTPVEEIVKKVDEFVASLQDEDKKSKAKEYVPHCQKLFVNTAARKRRNIHRKKHRSLLDYFETHLSWLSEEQKEKLWSFEAMGYPERRLQAAIREYYEETTGEKRTDAKRLLKGACVELFTSILGQDNVSQLKRMSEDGTPVMDIITRVDEFIDEIEDEDEKLKAQENMPLCRSLFVANRR